MEAFINCQAIPSPAPKANSPAPKAPTPSAPKAAPTPSAGFPLGGWGGQAGRGEKSPPSSSGWGPFEGGVGPIGFRLTSL